METNPVIKSAVKKWSKNSSRLAFQPLRVILLGQTHLDRSALDTDRTLVGPYLVRSASPTFSDLKSDPATRMGLPIASKQTDI